jgi:hypothetical protein
VSVTEPSHAVNAGMAKRTGGRQLTLSGKSPPSVNEVIGGGHVAVSGHRSPRVTSEMSEQAWFRAFTVVVVGSNMLVVFDTGLLYVKR